MNPRLDIKFRIAQLADAIKNKSTDEDYIESLVALLGKIKFPNNFFDDFDDEEKISQTILINLILQNLPRVALLFIETFQEHEALLYHADNTGHTALWYALNRNHEEIAHKLLFGFSSQETIYHDALWNQHDKVSGKKILHLTVYNSEMLNKLLALKNPAEKTFSCNELDTTWNSPLHYAAKIANKKAIVLLIENGARLDIQNKESITPIEIIVDSDPKMVRGIFRDLSEDGRNRFLAAYYGFIRHNIWDEFQVNRYLKFLSLCSLKQYITELVYIREYDLQVPHRPIPDELINELINIGKGYIPEPVLGKSEYHPLSEFQYSDQKFDQFFIELQQALDAIGNLPDHSAAWRGFCIGFIVLTVALGIATLSLFGVWLDASGDCDMFGESCSKASISGGILIPVFVLTCLASFAIALGAYFRDWCWNFSPAINAEDIQAFNRLMDDILYNLSLSKNSSVTCPITDADVKELEKESHKLTCNPSVKNTKTITTGIKDSIKKMKTTCFQKQYGLFHQRETVIEIRDARSRMVVF